MNIAILGATKGMGRSLARAFALRGDRLVLLGRNPDQLQRSAADLEVYATGSIAGVVPCDLRHPETFADALDEAWNAAVRIDTVILTAAIFAPQHELETDAQKTEALLTVNFTNSILFCEEVRRRLLREGGGTLCVFSSVAGDRGRKPVVLYGAAKAGLSAYLEGLDHKFRGAGLKTVCIKPGFVKTGMTAGLDPPPFAGDPDRTANDVIKAIERGKPIAYSPPIWRLIMWVIRNLPRFIMRRIGF